MPSIFSKLYCPNCGKKISESDDLCPNCGLDLNQPIGQNELLALTQELLEEAREDLERGRNLKKALANCDQAIEYMPDSANAHNLRGLVLEALGKTEQATREFQEAVRLDPELEDAKRNLRDESILIPKQLGRMNSLSLAATKRAAETKFLTDKQGTTYFFPRGDHGEGYVITDPNIRKRFTCFYSYALFLILFAAFVLCAFAFETGNFTLLIVGVLGCFFLWFLVIRTYTNYLVQSLPVTQKKFKDIVLDNWFPDADSVENEHH